MQVEARLNERRAERLSAAAAASLAAQKAAEVTARPLRNLCFTVMPSSATHAILTVLNLKELDGLLAIRACRRESVQDNF